MSAIGGDAIGSLEAELLLAAQMAGCTGDAIGAFVRRRFSAAMVRRRSEFAAVIRPGLSGVRVLARSIWLAIRAEDLVGEIVQSDASVIIDAAPFDAALLPLPLAKGDRLVRFSGTAREQVFTLLERAHIAHVAPYDIYYRANVRG